MYYVLFLSASRSPHNTYCKLTHSPSPPQDDADGKLNGYIRIRSKTQGIALSLGDRITAVQRAVISPEQP
jgi:hypothetical protein